jgi:hypothetical protein
MPTHSTAVSSHSHETTDWFDEKCENEIFGLLKEFLPRMIDSVKSSKARVSSRKAKGKTKIEMFSGEKVRFSYEFRSRLGCRMVELVELGESSSTGLYVMPNTLVLRIDRVGRAEMHGKGEILMDKGDGKEKEQLNEKMVANTMGMYTKIFAENECLLANLTNVRCFSTFFVVPIAHAQGFIKRMK